MKTGNCTNVKIARMKVANAGITVLEIMFDSLFFQIHVSVFEKIDQGICFDFGEKYVEVAN